MLYLIILVSLVVLGWLYIISRLLSRISEQSEKLSNVVPLIAFIFLIVPFILLIVVWHLQDYCSSFFSLNIVALFNDYPILSKLAGLALIWILIESFVRVIRRYQRWQKIKHYVSHQSTSIKLDWPCPSSRYKYLIYFLAKFIPTNHIDKLIINKYKIISAKIKPNATALRIVQLTDIHYSYYNQFYQNIVNEVNNLDADIIVLTGDLIYNYKDLSTFKKTFQELKAKKGIYYVCGNHEFLDGVALANQVYSEMGFEHLAGRCCSIEIDGNQISILGTEQPWSNEKFDFDNIKNYCIALSHDPDNIKWLNHKNIDLVLSGHTHGGQIALPALGPFIVPSKYVSYHEKGFVPYNPTLLYISLGLAIQVPIRLSCPLEISVFDLESAP